MSAVLLPLIMGPLVTVFIRRKFTKLEPDVIENKYYAPGIGQVLTIMTQGGFEREELVSITYQ
jgi:hypothetical protein